MRKRKKEREILFVNFSSRVSVFEYEDKQNGKGLAERKKKKQKTWRLEDGKGKFIYKVKFSPRGYLKIFIFAGKMETQVDTFQ